MFRANTVLQNTWTRVRKIHRGHTHQNLRIFRSREHGTPFHESRLLSAWDCGAVHLVYILYTCCTTVLHTLSLCSKYRYTDLLYYTVCNIVRSHIISIHTVAQNIVDVISISYNIIIQSSSVTKNIVFRFFFFIIYFNSDDSHAFRAHNITGVLAGGILIINSNVLLKSRRRTVSEKRQRPRHFETLHTV